MKTPYTNLGHLCACPFPTQKYIDWIIKEMVPVREVRSKDNEKRKERQYSFLSTLGPCFVSCARINQTIEIKGSILNLLG